MINFHTWLSQIIKYCAFIADRPGLLEAWINRDFSHTSVTDFDELYEQIFDDLDSDTFDAQLETHLSTHTAARESLSRFLGTLRKVNQLREQHTDLRNPHTLLQSAEWDEVENAARQVKTALGER